MKPSWKATQVDDRAGSSDVSSPVKKKKKTFHVDPFPVKPTKRERREYFDETWKLLQQAIQIIFGDENGADWFNVNYVSEAVKGVCLAKRGRDLCNLIQKECEPLISRDIRSLEKQSSDTSVFLRLAEKCWVGFREKMTFVNDIAMYEVYDGKTIWDMGLAIYQKELSRASQVQEKVIAGILALITDERSGNAAAADRSLVKNLMDMFDGEPGVVKKRFMDSTSEFYAAKSVQVLQNYGFSEYMKFVECVFDEEEKKQECYHFYLRYWEQLMEVLKKELLEVHTCAFEKGFTELMDEGGVDDLRRMFGLFSWAGMVGNIDHFLKSYISDKGRDGSLEELKNRVCSMWRDCFEEDALLHQSIRKCFKDLGVHVPGEYETFVVEEPAIQYGVCEED
nr:PREDICTED: cullin-like protein 5 [Rhinolophus sinicus]